MLDAYLKDDIILYIMIEDRIYQEYIQALRSKNKQKSVFLSFIRAELKNKAIDLKKDRLDDTEALVVLKKQQKKLNDQKESITASGRINMVDDIEKEISSLAEYLPKPLGEDQLLKIIESKIAAIDSPSMKDMGKIMTSVLSEVGLRADSRMVSSIVKNRLSS